ncbi:hypothetical protein V6N13_061310 [Hibiscus sabdariffa]
MVISPYRRWHDHDRLPECLASHRPMFVAFPRRRADYTRLNHHGKYLSSPPQWFLRWPAIPVVGSLFVAACSARSRPLLELFLRFVHPLIWMLLALTFDIKDRLALVSLCQPLARSAMCALCATFKHPGVCVGSMFCRRTLRPHSALLCRALAIFIVGACVRHAALGRLPNPRCAIDAHPWLLRSARHNRMAPCACLSFGLLLCVRPAPSADPWVHNQHRATCNTLGAHEQWLVRTPNRFSDRSAWALSWPVHLLRTSVAWHASYFLAGFCGPLSYASRLLTLAFLGFLS